MRKFRDPQAGALTRIWGADTHVYRGTSGALISIDAGYSGHPLTLVPPIVVQDELRSGRLVEHCRLPELVERFYAIVQVRRFPNPLVRWHYHEEYELHLIVATRGKVFVGDYIGQFEPGHLVLTGPRLPHNWISTDVPEPGVALRDMVLQFPETRFVWQTLTNLTVVVTLLAVNQLAVTIYLRRCHGGDASFVARDLPSGLRVANARLAEESYRYRDENGHERCRTTWHSIVLYGPLANIAETFEKGENVRIVGTLLSRQFTPKDGSKPRTVWEVVAREAYVIAPRRGPRRSTPEPMDDGPVPLVANGAAVVVEAGEDGWV